MNRKKLSQIIEKLAYVVSPSNFVNSYDKKWEIWGASILVPKKHHLKQLVENYPKYQINLQIIADLLYIKNPDYLFIDIGGNIGDTALLLNQNSPKNIVTIEPEDFYYEYLLSNTKPYKNIKTYKLMLTDNVVDNYDLKLENGTAIPILNKRNHIQSSHKNQTLDQFINENKFSNLGLIKIDTDGFDLKIIYSGLNSIETEKPILFFELDPFFYLENAIEFNEIRVKLIRFGYSKIIFYDFQGGKLVTLDLINENAINELIEYVRYKENSIPYFDVAIFSSVHLDILSKLS